MKLKVHGKNLFNLISYEQNFRVYLVDNSGFVYILRITEFIKCAFGR